jgi:uncharacterized protein
MKIIVAQIPPEGLTLEEDILTEKFDLDTPIVKFRSPIKVQALINKITNVVTVDLDVRAQMFCICSRCAEEFAHSLDKHFNLNYPVDKSIQTLDLDPDIRQEIILEFPEKPLCKPDCRGLCVTCGKNLNQTQCSCPKE